MLNGNNKKTEKENGFYINNDLVFNANLALNNCNIKEFFNSFTHTKFNVNFANVSDCIFSVGNANKPILNGNNYVINVTESGIYAVASNPKWLIRAFIKTLTLITHTDSGCLYIPVGEVKNDCKGILSVHYCLFYDNKLYELERFIKFISAVGYTHLFLEFWGSYKYKCLPELGFKNAFTYNDIKPLINVANNLGVEVCPQFNHWGHASQCRIMHGKHVVLNQNPALYYLFDDSGWCYNVNNAEVKKLLYKARRELIDLCGDAEYFHIGCDEAYGFNYDSNEILNVTSFINEITADLKSLNRKTVMWGDMLLSSASYTDGNAYCVGAPTTEKATEIISNLDKNIIIADWQYHAKTYPVLTSKTLLDAGFNVIICPWDRGFNEMKSCVQTAKNYNLLGVMHTTWHTLTSGMPYVYFTANEYVTGGSVWRDGILKTASILRKAYNAGGDYEKSGFAPYEIGVST